MGRGMRQWLESAGKYALLDRQLSRAEARDRTDYSIPDFPTLAHVPGVEISKKSRYRTKVMHMVESKRRAVLKPRLLFVGQRRQAQLVHLGNGLTLNL